VSRPDIERTTVATFAHRLHEGTPIVMATAYDFATARLVDAAGLDAILVGDSLGMVVLGHDDTLSVTVDDIVHHARAVRRAAVRTMVIADMPALSYEVPEQAIANARRLVEEGGADAIKLEGGTRISATVRAIIAAGIPVQGHIGLTPQQVRALGGWRVQGRTAEDARLILEDAWALQDAGCFSVVIECVPAVLGAHLTRSLTIPTIGIGAGPGTSGQVLVLHDLLGLTPDPLPRFVKRFADVSAVALKGLTRYREEVRSRVYPADEHTYDMHEAEWQRFLQHSSAGGTPMNRDELKGKGEQLKGRAKQAVGDLTNDERLHDEGVADEVSGDVQEGFGRARRKIGEKVEEIGERLKD
jgi:3-methyl-2-oxobutanoate hydroxymethyltransferase